MKIVLLKQVSQLGNRGDIVDVADGYARNFLIPQGAAQMAAAGIETQAAVMRKSWNAKNAKQREAAEALATQLVSKSITITARASGEGKLFGSVSSADVANAVAEQTGVELDRKMLDLGEGIKALGTHTVTAQPHDDVQFPVTVEVTSA